MISDSKNILITFLLLTSTTCSFGQTRDTASASAEVIVSSSLIEIMKDPINKISTSANGKITFAPICIRMPNDATKHPASINIKTIAIIALCGEPGYLYTVTLPERADITGPEGAKMTFSGFTTNLYATGSLNTDGTEIFRVSANLVISSLQQPGVYVSTTNVIFIINYN